MFKLYFRFSIVLMALIFIYPIKSNAQNAKAVEIKTVSDIKSPYKFKYKGNPLVSYRSSTDPDVHVWDGVVWMYCSQDHQRDQFSQGSYDYMDGYHARRN